VLLVGGGGREHALAWKLRQSPRLGQLWLTDPSNAALSKLGKPCPHKFEPPSLFQLQRWIEKNTIHLVVVGPEQPLAEGIVDQLQTSSTLVFGPNKAAAQLEADKAFAKQLMRQAAVPTAEGHVFRDAQSALRFLEQRRGALKEMNAYRGNATARAHHDDTAEEAWVVKAAGLAGGKGAIVCDTFAEAENAVRRIGIEREFGSAGNTILIEERLHGQEITILALVDGHTIWMLDPCQDHKQRDEGDTGPNTGGMGAYCPAPLIDVETIRTVERDILVPIIDALRREEIEYRGVLYAGIMLTPGGPKVLEFNCRFGDPECQPLMARLNGDLVEILWATCTGTLSQIDFDFDLRTACCVVMCSEGYPDKYEKGRTITGIEEAESLSDDAGAVIVFHSGTTINHNGALVTTGGRVLGVTALGEDVRQARDLANAACDRIHFDGAFFRRDIGNRVLNAKAPVSAPVTKPVVARVAESPLKPTRV
jgi:phosphoribosylamine--glycine ligase